jgi:hypothetical protein
MDIKHLGATEYCRDEILRLRVTLDQKLAAGDELYAELEGPDGSSRCILKSESSMQSSNGYLIDGMVPPDAPLGFYRVTKLEVRRTVGGSKVLPLEIPHGEPGILIVQSKPQRRSMIPKVISVS